MSDIFLSAGMIVDNARLARAFSWTSRTWSEYGNEDDIHWVASRVDDRRDWASARHPGSGVRALIGGRIALDSVEWRSAQNMPIEGGFAARHVVALFLNGGAESLETINGGALIVVIDPRTRVVHLRTDRMGMYPMFAIKGRGVALSSHPDILAAAFSRAERPVDFDQTTAAEFLATGTAIQPYTYWRNVTQLEPASRYVLTTEAAPKLSRVCSYWSPSVLEGDVIRSRGEVVERLAESMRNAVRLRTQQRLGSPALLLSSGADSRTVLFAARNPSDFTTYTLYDEKNAETRGAEQLSSAAGAQHVPVQRDPEYYIRHAPEAVRITSGMWSIESAHYGGLAPYFQDRPPGALFTGCYADYMLKGIAFNSLHYKIAGKALPIKYLSPFKKCWHHPHFSLASDWSARVRERFDNRFGEIVRRSDPADPELEFLRITPIVREPDAAGRLYLRRTTPFDSFLMDHGVIDVYGAMGAEHKINGIPFGMAVDRICGQSVRGVVNNNYGAPVGASEAGRIASFLISSLRRKIGVGERLQPFEIRAGTVATVGSWPHFPRVLALSERVLDWFTELPADHRELIFDFLGTDRAKWSLDDWIAKEPMLLVRVFTLSLWLSHREQLA